jgi:hypothetical protein
MMFRLLLFGIFIISCLATYGQKEEPLIIYKCDLPQKEIMMVSEYPPIMKIKTGELETILKKELNFPAIENDSTFTIYISVIIDCDSTATYDLPLNEVNRTHLETGLQIIEILKANCSWSPGKSSIEITKRILKKEKNKIVSYDQYIYHLTKFRIGLKFKIQGKKIKVEN